MLFRSLPIIVFVISGIISFATGTAWGTMAIVIPLAVPLAEGFILNSGADPSLIIVTLGTVMSGAIFGDHCSPISDTTIMSSTASGSDHLHHVSTQMPYAITVAIVSAICFILAGFTSINAGVILLIGIAILIGTIRVLGKSIKEEDLKKDTVKVN